MEIIKSDRISILPIANKSKKIILDTYLNNILIAKNNIAYKSVIDKSFQDKLFSNDKKLLSCYPNFSQNIFSKWELQKFFNSDLIEKELVRIERFFTQYKSSLFTIEKQKDGKSKKIRKSSKLSSLIKLMVKNLYFKDYYTEEINKLFDSNKFFLSNKIRIEKLVNNIFNRYKYNRKPINYTTPSIIKCGQKDLGNTKPRIIKDNSNSKYKYWYLIDYMDLVDNKKKYMKLPLSYNEDYHNDFKDYSKSLGTNKFKKNKTNLIKQSVINFDKLDNNFEVLFEKEHQISLSKNTNRLTITLPKQSTHNLVETKINNNNCLGVDIGGSFINTMVNSKGKFTSFNYLENLVNKIDKIDKLPNNIKEDRLYKGKLIAKVLRENEYQINIIIKDYLDYCDNNGINNLVFEKLDSWNVKWKRDKTLDEKYNRVFKLLRTQGLVELFKKQARKRNILIHTIPSYYTSQRCSKCGEINKENLKTNRTYKCKCGHEENRDINASKNMKQILERFSNVLCKKNKFNEYEAINYITKKYVFQILNGEIKEKFKPLSYELD